MTTDSHPPLADVRVLDASRVLAGPLCGQVLGDLGAEVIKVERPGQGDDTRAWGPPFAGDLSAYFLSCNRNKKGITLDLSKAEGLEIFYDLVQRSDILLENFRAASAAKLGLSPEILHARNPRLIICSISGFGRTGPLSDQPGYDFAIQGRGGIMSITGEPDGPPMKVGLAIVDVTAAQYAAVAILAALEARHTTGRGQRIDISLLDSQIAWLVNRAGNYLVGGAEPQRHGNAHPSIVPYESFRARDKWFTVAVGNDSQFARLAQTLGAPELASDPRFVSNPARVEHRLELVELLSGYFRRRDAEEWLTAFRREKIPGGPINSIPEALADPQVLARDMVIEMPHPTAGVVRLVGSPLKLSETPAAYVRHPPLLGEHTDEVLAELGYDADEVRSLRQHGIV
jgi:formyl-CoA transferase